MTTPTMWHADDALLDRYAAGSLDMARAASVEAHLVACAACREAVGARVDCGRLGAIWAEIVNTVDAPRRRPAERVLARLGVRPHTARLLVATRSLQVSWLVAVALALGFAVAAASQGRHSDLLFLIVAPILPVAGVAAAFGPAMDSAFEVAPLTGARLLLVRSAAVLVTTITLAALAALALPSFDWMAVAWVLPSLGLTTSCLALSTVTTPERAAGAVTTAWFVAVLLTVGEMRDGLAAFRTSGQFTFLGLTALAGFVIVRRRGAFEIKSAL